MNFHTHTDAAPEADYWWILFLFKQPLILLQLYFSTFLWAALLPPSCPRAHILIHVHFRNINFLSFMPLTSHVRPRSQWPQWNMHPCVELQSKWGTLMVSRTLENKEKGKCANHASPCTVKCARFNAVVIGIVGQLEKTPGAELSIYPLFELLHMVVARKRQRKNSPKEEKRKGESILQKINK